MSFDHVRGGQTEKVTPLPGFTEEQVRELIDSPNGYVGEVHPRHVYKTKGDGEAFASYEVIESEST